MIFDAAGRLCAGSSCMALFKFVLLTFYLRRHIWTWSKLYLHSCRFLCLWPLVHNRNNDRYGSRSRYAHFTSTANSQGTYLVYHRGNVILNHTIYSTTNVIGLNANDYATFFGENDQSNSSQSVAFFFLTNVTQTAAQIKMTMKPPNSNTHFFCRFFVHFRSQLL